MRIVYLCADRGIPVLGHKGASVHLRSLAAALRRRGHDVLLAASAIAGENPPPVGVALETLPRGNAEATSWLATRLGDWRPDVVLERYSLDSGPGLSVVRVLGLPFVLEVNAPLADEAARYRGLSEVDAWRERERKILRASDRVIAVSNGIRNHVLRAGVAAERVVVIPNGVDLTLFRGGRGNAVRRRYGLRGLPVVGFAGSLKPWHGLRTLVLAMAGLSQAAHLLVVGDGPERKEVERFATECGIAARLRMAGAIAHERVPDYLAAMDIGVAPYDAQPDFYFSPLKVIEYLAAALPVVASNQGDLPEIIGDAGILVPPADPEALREALRRLLEDEGLRGQLGARADARARAMSWDNVAARVEAVLSLRAVAA